MFNISFYYECKQQFQQKLSFQQKSQVCSLHMKVVTSNKNIDNI